MFLPFQSSEKVLSLEKGWTNSAIKSKLAEGKKSPL